MTVVCPWCGHPAGLNGDGLVRLHYDTRVPLGLPAVCPGSMKPVTSRSAANVVSAPGQLDNVTLTARDDVPDGGTT